jgi:hypothetical protein
MVVKMPDYEEWELLTFQSLRWSNNTSATAAPTVNDDLSVPYGPGSIWVHDSTIYMCMDGAIGAAVWKMMTVAIPAPPP